MEKPKWTPGPWRVINANDATLFPSVVLHDRGVGKRPAQITVNEGADGESLARGAVYGTTMETAAANAHLIAAAPELHDALAAVCWHWANHPREPIDDIIMVHALPALAKARGEPS